MAPVSFVCLYLGSDTQNSNNDSNSNVCFQETMDEKWKFEKEASIKASTMGPVQHQGIVDNQTLTINKLPFASLSILCVKISSEHLLKMQEV